ncbi:MAG: EAL domain-containing protein [Gammaproteobacteria bacterium]|nr:EAL domain-containing protein [Gammaproteobacteria bacterium]
MENSVNSVVKMLEQGLDIESQLCPLILAVDEGIQLWDSSGRKRFMNPATLQQFGEKVAAAAISYEEMAALCCDEMGQAIPPHLFPVAQALTGATVASDMLVQLQAPVSDCRWLRLSARPLIPQGATAAVGILSSSIDVTHLFEYSQQLHRQANFDVLTGLPNRLFFADRIKLAIAHAQRNNKLLAVCMLDLDGFKPVNDHLGHDAGDLLLKEIAHRLESEMRGEDTVARLGGDEFALILGEVKSPIMVEQFLQRLLDVIARPHLIHDQPVRVGASIGVTLYPTDAVEADQLLRFADQAMYKAKDGGKGRYHFFNSAAELRNKANQVLLQRIDAALTSNQFLLYYQPKVDCRSGVVVGMEALVRWHHPILGLRSPAEFLPLIEHDNIIVRLGEWVINTVLAQLVKWREVGAVIQVSVNVSARQFIHGGLEQRLGELLANYPPEICSQLELELVETAALEDITAVRQVMARYQKRGVKFALDDFGTGYSSLVHLKRLAVDVLKIDQTFIRDMVEDPGDLAIVQGVIGLASAFGLKVVAEGVESIDQTLLLLRLGCDVMQGYAISRPMPVDRVGEWLQDFHPDPRWQLAGGSYPQRGDFELLLMEVFHHHWLEKLRVAVVEGGEPPDCNHDNCRFSQWYSDSGIRRYGAFPLFRQLDEVHRQVHKQALRLLESLAVLPRDEVDFHAVEKANQLLIAQLSEFRKMQSGIF